MKSFNCDISGQKLTLVKSENLYKEMSYNKINYWDCKNESCDLNKNKS